MSWQDDVLSIGGWPNTRVNQTALTYWAQSEGMPPQYFNWLATTENGYGGRVVNSVGVKAYPTTAAGAEATVATISNGNYTAIVIALTAGDNLGQIWRAINGSPWCGGCQNGRYPVALWNVLQVGGVGGFAGSVTPAPPRSSGPARNHAKASSAWDAFRRYYGQEIGNQAQQIALLADNMRRGL